MSRFIQLAFTFIIALTVIYGCGGSSMKSGGDQTGSASSPQEIINTAGFVGSDVCLNCHAGIEAKFLDGENPHVFHSNHINHAEGEAETATFNGQEVKCNFCHDTGGDGLLIMGYISDLLDDTTVAKGLSAVGCENCHGSGQLHFGMGPITEKPDFKSCGETKCHNNLVEVGHTLYHPEAANIYNDYVSSKHYSGGFYEDHAVGSELTKRCSKCHTDEGAKELVNIDGTRDQLGTQLLPSTLPKVSGWDRVQCRTCHDSHSPFKLLEKASTVGDQVVQSAEYNTCTNCHQDGQEGDTGYHDHGDFSDSDMLMYDTHFDDPATPDKIEGYVVKADSGRACRDCHNVHSANIEINQQWAKSGHGGDILGAKEEADADDDNATNAFNATVNNDNNGVWNHYDWDASNRQACQRCHTATGIKNFATDTANYNAANNDFSHLNGWTNDAGVVTSSGQNELLYCWGCHTNNAGGLRTPGDFTIGLSNGASMTYAKDTMGKSSLCYACHTGRETGDSIKNSTADFTNASFINSHYMAAGGIISSKVGFHYGDRNYDSNIKNTGAANDYRHDDLGVSATGVDTADAYIAENGLSDSGQCIVCHLTSGNGSHTLSPVTKYSETDTSLNPVCVTCHTSRGEGTNAKVVWLENSWGARFAAGLDAVQYVLAQKGIYFASSYPYFFKSADNPTSANAFKNWGNKETMGAAFNFNLLKHESGAIAHNRFYVRRLIYDSIDFLDDGVLNYSVYNTLSNLSDDLAFKANAITLLINKGTDNVNIGTTLERY